MNTTRFIVLAVTAGILGCSERHSDPTTAAAPIIPAEEALALFGTEVMVALVNLHPDPKDKAAAEQRLRTEFSRIINKYAPSLRPEEGSKRYVSNDESFVLVIAANGTNGKKGAEASVADDQVRVVVAIGGDGSPAPQGGGAGGGSASARAPICGRDWSRMIPSRGPRGSSTTRARHRCLAAARPARTPPRAAAA